MNFVLWRYDARRAVSIWTSCLAVVSALALLIDGPLTDNDLTWIWQFAGLGAGTLIAWRMFADTGGTQAYVFSRGFSRSQLFWNRWILGMSLVAVLVFWMWLILAGGLRSGWRQWAGFGDAGLYPLIAPYEAIIVPTFAATAWGSFAVTTLLVVLRGIQRPGRVVGGRGTLGWWMLDVPLCVAASVAVVGLLTETTLGPGWMITAWAAVSAPLTTLAAWHGYRHLEVSA
ncbi:MAG TPA: hypothetical protein VGM05_16725 [Planctomycetaceae bacterium]|jgi:hypothetical protein